VSERIYDEFYGDLETLSKVNEVYPADLAVERLSDFAMNNPELSRAWLFDVMSTQGTVTDKFWKKYVQELGEFAKSAYGREDIDVEVLAFITLSSALLWPIWVGAHAKSAKARDKMQQRFVDEMLRLVLFGSLVPEKHPELVKRFRGNAAGDSPGSSE
jgi:hypothetical protein